MLGRFCFRQGRGGAARKKMYPVAGGVELKKKKKKNCEPVGSLAGLVNSRRHLSQHANSRLEWRRNSREGPQAREPADHRDTSVCFPYAKPSGKV